MSQRQWSAEAANTVWEGLHFQSQVWNKMAPVPAGGQICETTRVEQLRAKRKLRRTRSAGVGNAGRDGKLPTGDFLPGPARAATPLSPKP